MFGVSWKTRIERLETNKFDVSRTVSRVVPFSSRSRNARQENPAGIVVSFSSQLVLEFLDFGTNSLLALRASGRTRDGSSCTSNMQFQYLH